VATKQRKSLEEIEAQITGGEPKFPNEVITESQMMAALNWFSKNRDGKQASKYITDYLKKQKIKVAADVINRQNSTFGYLCRLKSTGGKLSDKHEAKFTEYMDAMVAAVSKPVEVKEDKKPTVSIQDRLAEKISEIIGELEGTIDDYILGQFKKSPVPYGVMHGMNAKGMHANKISEWAKYRRAQFEEALESDDPQIKEGWSNFNKVQLKKLIAYCDLIITDCIKISGESMASRKPRKRKVKSPDQLVAKVKILESDETFKLKSVPAKDIIGALQLWVFNVKTKKLGVYNAEDAGGLSVKGSSLLNYNEGKSVTKTLRKPDVVLPEVLKGGKVFLRNVMENLTTKDSPANGRLNGDTILLRVIK
jgi:hypothetical protein